MRTNISSDAPWEPIVGYSRAVKVDLHVFVAGTTGTVNGKVVGPGLYEQTVQAIRNVESALTKAGGSLKDVVRTRVFVTDISQWEEAARAHGEFFREIRPACTMLAVAALVDPSMVVEVEVDAILGEAS
ncbi:MAG: RidA family protein [candidate division Zixibacteria bacterium]|nr:RidA family protein [candidate division Zixibacteria bacterium]